MTTLSDLYCIIKDSGIKIRWTDTPAPSVTLDDRKGYTIHIPKQLNDISNEEHKAVLLHEFAHVLHGDLLAKQAKEDPRLWNVACDARINRSELVPPLTSVVRQLQGEKARPIVYETLLSFASELPADHVPPAPMIFETLKKRSSASSGPGQAHDELHPGTGDPDELKKRHAETLVRARRALQKHPDVSRAVGDIGKLHHRKTRSVEFSPEPLAKIDAILSRLDGIDGRRQFSRTWVRPRRLGTNTNLRGGAYLPRPRLLVIVDVSGSRAERLDVSQALVDACRDRFEAETIVHDVDAVLLEPGKDLPPGGGTAFVPAFKLARTLKPDCIVHITDLETHDAEEAYGLASCPVVVAVDDPSQARNAPKGVEVVAL